VGARVRAIGLPRILLWQGGSQVTDQEFSKKKELISGVARLERAHVQGFQRAHPSSPHRVRLGPRPQRWARVHCTPCIPCYYATGDEPVAWGTFPQKLRENVILVYNLNAFLCKIPDLMSIRASVDTVFVQINTI